MDLPLSGVRVLDLTDGPAQWCGRYLADLGADVVLAEPPGGSPSRFEPPLHAGQSLPFALRNANKRTTVGAPPSSGLPGAGLLATADIVLDSRRSVAPGDYPDAVVVSITPFGNTGPYADWSAPEPVLAALGGVLSRSGLPGRPPLLPPAGLVDGVVGAHAAWVALAAYLRRLRTGAGEYVDVSALECVVHGFDPGFGTQGTAAAGRAETFPRDRPEARNFYPVFACRDGEVRICLLAKRQWRAMFSWLGEPAEFADPRYDTIPARFAAADRLHPLIAALFRDLSREELVAEGVRRGVPVAAVLTVPEVLGADHFAVTGALDDVEIAPGVTARVPTGYVTLDGKRAGIRTPALQADHATWLPAHPAEEVTPRAAGSAGAADAAGGADVAWAVPPVGAGDPPLAGLRVLDLGVIVFGAELGRVFADLGADVVKVENPAFPDGLRQSRRGSGTSASFAWGQRNKRSIGVDLRHPDGAALFRALAAEADVVLANFKPGTLDALGFSPATLAALNPRLVISDSSAFGDTGPWSSRMGYGPLVRAATGVTARWRPASESDYCDGATVYPDHIAAQLTAVAVLASVIGRVRTGRGRTVGVAQADVALLQLGTQFAAASLGLSLPEPWPEPAVVACAGDDEWCVIAVRDDADRARLRAVVDSDASVAEWAASRTPDEVMRTLQAAGVPAGAMRRLPDELTDPQLTTREAFATLHHDDLPEPLPTAARPARFAAIGDPPLRPAPRLGQHTREICAPLADVDALLEAGVLHEDSSVTSPTS
ncbi:CaiB/BaiF CoA-transferase family protein [Cryptosporangium aurantiacum]|uniref:Crotonobetainyl-CoA:carnitine CoA-transferase CaiB n=1 Tax=Cryptosporangium aurantiacum TaxID=134849 RepID=A0A1M7RKI4_9ACTN|nr:CoA transferase [Cryptosporangium aurantiacum]SHN46656.1 Crotonobetainyl-CoA:carnitine CoA-transferase CaiB [Cryptosporangium aurantiacum]